MRKMLWALAGLIVVALGVIGGVLAFDAPVKPPPFDSISKPFVGLDFSALPAVQTYAARDGANLGYRVYDGAGAQVVVLIHGSSDDGSGIHLLAMALHDAGASVYAPVLRGHGNSGSSGDIAYIGQLEDDLADFVKVLRPLHPNASFSLIGFSSGGGFVLRVIGASEEKLFDRFIMISPALPPGAPTVRPNTGGWVSVAMPRIIVLAMLNRIGIGRFNGLPIVAFATPPTVPISPASIRSGSRSISARRATIWRRSAAARSRPRSWSAATTSCSFPIASRRCSGRRDLTCPSRSCPASAISA